jgi:hypothetical protein
VKFKEAAAAAPKHKDIYEELCASYSAEQVRGFLANITAWQECPDDHPDPYQEGETGKLQLLHHS